MGPRAIGDFLEQHTERQVADFYHATKYLADVADAYYETKPKERKVWLNARCHDLKHKRGAAHRILREMDEWTVSME